MMRLALLLVAAALAGSAQSPEVEHFERKIRPVLVEQCASCHSSALETPMGGLRVDSRDALRRGGASGPALVPGQPEQSLLLKALRYQDPALKMPPTGKLPDRVIEDFEAWISSGAQDPREEAVDSAKTAKASGPGTPIEEGRRWWAFQPLAELPTPDYVRRGWARRKVDAFVIAGLEENALEPSPEADRRTLIRRASIDLTGLPPSYEETEAFAADPSPAAYEELIDRLLASPHYGERWGRHWLDVARWAEDHPNQRIDQQAARVRLALSGLGDRSVQQRHPLRSIHPDAVRRRPDAGFRTVGHASARIHRQLADVSQGPKTLSRRD